MANLNLVLSLPHGMVTATSLGLSGFVWHQSPGTARKFHGRSILVDLALRDGYPAFAFLEEGGWRDANADAKRALEAAKAGKRTKTALSNNAFSCTPFSAYAHVHLAKSGGELLEMAPGGTIATFKERACSENLPPDRIAEAAGLPRPSARRPRLYLVICPVELLVLTNLTPEEYVWYSTHRTGKVFRQVLFAEIGEKHIDLIESEMAAGQSYEAAHRTLTETPTKKTKTIAIGECFSRVPYAAWKGYDGADGGLYAGDHGSALVWRFPKQIPRAWDKAI